MKRRVAVFALADLDLDSIADFLAADDLRVAARFIASVAASYDSLAENPGLGRLFDTDVQTLQGIRIWPIPGFTSYLLFYRATDEAVEVLRILHGSRDIDRALGQNPPSYREPIPTSQPITTNLSIKQRRTHAHFLLGLLVNALTLQRIIRDRTGLQ